MTSLQLAEERLNTNNLSGLILTNIITSNTKQGYRSMPRVIAMPAWLDVFRTQSPCPSLVGSNEAPGGLQWLPLTSQAQCGRIILVRAASHVSGSTHYDQRVQGPASQNGLGGNSEHVEPRMRGGLAYPLQKGS